MYSFYRKLTLLAAPLVPLLLKARLARGKEDALRLPERLGKAGMPRPQGKLVWIHAASVGEANAALPLMEGLLAAYPALHVLLTTVTVTSAALMASRLPERAIHQFAPVDTPEAVRMFLSHWKPDIALWVDSELWPNLIVETHKSGAVMGIVNARMSQRSARIWIYLRPFAASLLSRFRFCFAQSREDAQRLKMLGMTSVHHIGNLKYDAPPLACDERELKELQAAIGTRAIWLAACTHPGEERIVAAIHRTLASETKSLLTFLVPRHASRGDAIAKELSSFHLARRSKKEPVTLFTDLYLADTMGELGLFYRLCPLAFIGGSLAAHGGQNPLEAAHLGCAIVLGPHMENFPAITKAMLDDHACIQAYNAQGLTEALRKLLADEALRRELAAHALRHVQSGGGVAAHIVKELRPYLA